MKPVLYNYFRSSASYRVRIAFNIKGIDFEYRPVNLRKAEQLSHEYLALNPKGEVPFLVDGSVRLSQSLVICDYLDSLKPENPLFPKEVLQRLKVLEICELIGAGIQPIQNLAVTNELEKRFGADENAKLEWNQFFIAKGFQGLEKLLLESSGKFCIGNQFTAADCFLVPQVFSAERFKFDVSKFPTIQKIAKACANLPEFDRAHPSKQIDFVG